MTTARSRPTRGVSLIEAVVAMAVMASGMLGIVGIQSSLRSNADVAKQRSEGVRLAQERIEELRNFVDMTSLPSGVAGGLYSGIVTMTPETIAPSATRPLNTTYTRTITVTEMDSSGAGALEAVPRAKSVSVTVNWQDRSGQTQGVTLNAAIAGIAPALAGTLAVPADDGALRQTFGRSRDIPFTALNIGGGRSAYVPPGTIGVTWVFDNVTAVINLCTLATVTTGSVVANTAVLAANITCGSSYAQFLGGFLRYSLTPSIPPLPPLPPFQPDALNPQSLWPIGLQALVMVVDQTAPFTTTVPLPVTCVMNQSLSPTLFTPYVCAVPVNPPTTSVPSPPWSGSLRAVISPDSFALGYTGGTAYRLCRYQLAASYANVDTSLQNQNFLVIERAPPPPLPPLPPFTCPLPPPDPLPSPLPDPKPVWTVTHQPRP